MCTVKPGVGGRTEFRVELKQQLPLPLLVLENIAPQLPRNSPSCLCLPVYSAGVKGTPPSPYGHVDVPGPVFRASWATLSSNPSLSTPVLCGFPVKASESVPWSTACFFSTSCKLLSHLVTFSGVSQSSVLLSFPFSDCFASHPCYTVCVPTQAIGLMMFWTSKVFSICGLILCSRSCSF